MPDSFQPLSREWRWLLSGGSVTAPGRGRGGRDPAESAPTLILSLSTGEGARAGAEKHMV